MTALSAHAPTAVGGERPQPYGWVVVAAVFALLCLSNGMALAGLSVFDEKLMAAMHVRLGALKLRDLVQLASAGLAAPLIGMIVDRIGSRTVVAIGLVMFSACLLAYGRVTSIGQIYLLHIALGVVFAATNVVVVVVLIARWFPLRRGAALGLALAGTSVGGVIFPQIVAGLLGHMDWRAAFAALAVIPLAAAPIFFLLLRAPKGAPAGAAEAAQAGPAAGGSTRAELFILLFVAVAIFYSGNVFTRHAFLFLRHEGMTVGVAATGISIVFLFGLIGKLAAGFATEALGAKKVFLLFESFSLAAALILLSMGGAGAWVGLACAGLGWGGGFVLLQLGVSRLAHVRLASVMGGFVIVESLSQGMGSWITGVLYDATGSYQVPFLVVAGLMLAAIIATATRLRLAASPPAA